MNARGCITPSRILGIVILVGAMLPLSLGGWFFFRTRAFLQTAVTTTGTVVELRSGGADGSMFTPVLEFQDSNGNTHTFTSSVSSNPPPYEVGETVQVFYASADPSDARIDGFWTLWFGPFVCGVMGIFPALFSLVFIWFIPFTIKRVWPVEHNADTQQ